MHGDEIVLEPPFEDKRCRIAIAVRNKMSKPLEVMARLCPTEPRDQGDARIALVIAFEPDSAALEQLQQLNRTSDGKNREYGIPHAFASNGQDLLSLLATNHIDGLIYSPGMQLLEEVRDKYYTAPGFGWYQSDGEIFMKGLLQHLRYTGQFA